MVLRDDCDSAMRTVTKDAARARRIVCATRWGQRWYADSKAKAHRGDRRAVRQALQQHDPEQYERNAKPRLTGWDVA